MLSTTDYEAQRASLIDEDRSLRREFLRTDLCSEKEREADKVLRAIRASETATIWNEEHPSIPHPFPGMEFLTGMCVLRKIGSQSPILFRQAYYHENEDIRDPEQGIPLFFFLLMIF